MKSKLKSTALALGCATALLGLPLSVAAQATEPTTPRQPMPDTQVSNNVTGKVEAKSNTTLTVAGRTVSINGSTTFSRNGASIGSGDIRVGDKVNVVTAANGQVAISVDVITEEGP